MLAMGITDYFSGGTGEKLEYLEEERKKIWAQLVKLEDQINKKTSDYEKEARVNSSKTSEFRNRSAEAKDAALENLSESEKALSGIKHVHADVVELSTLITNIKNSCNQNNNFVVQVHDEIRTLKDAIEEKSKTLENIFEGHEDLESKLDILENIFTEGSEKQNKININFTS